MTKAIQIKQFGGPEEMSFVDVPVGEPGPGQVRIRQHAIGLNFIDVYQRTGLYPNPLPLVPGTEGAGVIEAVGEGVTSVKPGERVAYAGGPAGAYAEVRVMPAAPLVRLPDSVSFEQAAALMLKGLTALYLLKRTQPQGGLQQGDQVLFHAAAGGVGLIACQIAKAMGLQLIGTAGSEDKCRLALEHGAAHAINYRTEDFVERVKQLSGGQKLKVVYDSIGKDTFERSLDCLRPFGLMVSYGNASGPVPPFSLSTLGPKGSLYVTRPTLFTYIGIPGMLQSLADELFGMVADGTVKIVIGQRHALKDAAQAHRELESRKTTGSTVLLP
jgi:NADPH2:quinone reductase